MTTKKLQSPRPREASPVVLQGSVEMRTRVIAYVEAKNSVVRKSDDSDVEFFCIDNLSRLIGTTEIDHFWPKSKVAVGGVGGAGEAFLVHLVLVDHHLRDAEKATLSGLVMKDAALVVGPRAADEFTWQLKAEANSRGRIFEVAESNTALEKLLKTTIHAVHLRFTHWLAKTEPSQLATTEADALASLPGVLEVTHTLRSDRGRLDAEKIRELFALSRADVARITGVQEETIRQTPDSERLQRSLHSFDRVARLLVLNPDRTKFATWLNSANDELDQRTPLDLIREGRIEVVETLVHDILTNRGR